MGFKQSCNGGVSSLQVAAHRKPVLTLLRMRDILARMMRRRPTQTLTLLQCGTRRRDVTSGVEACADPFWQPAFAVPTPFIKMSYRPHW
jgi:hypothetical protein